MRSRPTQPSANPTAQPAADVSTPTAVLSRSIVHRRLPPGVRVRLDEAILMRPKALPTLEAIAAHFELARYRISPPALRAYARRLENLARPAATGQLLAMVLGCLPPSYRRRVHDGTETLLLSRMAQALSSENPQPLSVADIARLGPVLATMARARRPRRSASAKQSQFGPSGPNRKTLEPTVVKKLVRGVYGLKLDAPKPASDQAAGEALPLLTKGGPGGASVGSLISG